MRLQYSLCPVTPLTGCNRLSSGSQYLTGCNRLMYSVSRYAATGIRLECAVRRANRGTSDCWYSRRSLPGSSVCSRKHTRDNEERYLRVYADDKPIIWQSLGPTRQRRVLVRNLQRRYNKKPLSVSQGLKSKLSQAVYSS